MARTHRSEYLRSNACRTLPLPDPAGAAQAAARLLEVSEAGSRRALGEALLVNLCRQTGIPAPELVVPDLHQPHSRRGRRIVYSLQGVYTRRTPSEDDPRQARGGRPLGRIRVPNRTPARGDIVRPTAFLHTLLHEFCHHHDAEAMGLSRSFHTAGFYDRLRHLRGQMAPQTLAAVTTAGRRMAAGSGARSPRPGRAAATRRVASRVASAEEVRPMLQRLWAIIRNL